MFASLRSRLIALYVVAALFLVAIVGVAVTAFAFSSFGFLSQQSVAAVARDAPLVAREELANGRSLEAAAPDIVRRLWRPALRVAVLREGRGYDRPLALSRGDDEEHREILSFGPPPPPGAFRKAPPDGRASPDLPPGRAQPASGPNAPADLMPAPGSLEGPARYEPRSDWPFRLNVILGLHPERIKLDGGAIVLFPDARSLQRSMSSFWKALLPIGLAAVIGAFLLGRYITDQAMRPLVETTASLERFAEGDFMPRPVVAARQDEIGSLARAYNRAAEQVATAFDERRRAEERMRQFIADAGHELRTPLTVVMGFIDVLRPRLDSDSRTVEALEIMRAESRRMKTLIDTLIRLARLERVDTVDPDRVPEIDATGTVRRAAAAFVALHAEARISVEANAHLPVRAGEDELYDAVANLIENALKYAPGSPVEVRAFDRDGFAVIEVQDHGPGLDQTEQKAVFERFYRGRDRSGVEGTGLGLAIVKRTAERGGGEAGVSSAPGQGARFWIRLPLAAEGRTLAAAAGV